MEIGGSVTRERRGHVLLVGLNRVAKRNAFDLAMLGELARAYGELERDAEVRCGVLFAHGEHFTGGVDLPPGAPPPLPGAPLAPPGGGRHPLWLPRGPPPQPPGFSL